MRVRAHNQPGNETVRQPVRFVRAVQSAYETLIKFELVREHIPLRRFAARSFRRESYPAGGYRRSRF